MSSQPEKDQQEKPMLTALENMDLSSIPPECKSETGQQTTNFRLDHIEPEIAVANSNKKVIKKEFIAIRENFRAWLHYELKLVFKSETKSLASLYTLPTSIKEWSCNDVRTFLTALGFNFAPKVFLAEKIDGIALLLLRREEILYSFGLLAGPALKICGIVEQLRQDFYVDMSDPD